MQLPNYRGEAGVVLGKPIEIPPVVVQAEQPAEPPHRILLNRLNSAGSFNMQGVIQDSICGGALAPYVKQEGTPRYPGGPIQAIANDQKSTQGRGDPLIKSRVLAKSKGASAAVVPSIVRTLVIPPPVSLDLIP